MSNSNDQSLSRRKWLRLASATSLGSGLLAATGAAAEPRAHVEINDPNLGARTYNVRDFGAKGDGTTLDTAAVQTAIDMCNKDQGGIVLVPAGVFLIGTIEMKSNVTLHIAHSGKLLGSADGKQYHAADAIPLSGDSTLGDGNVGLIFAVNAQNIVIEGPGTIDGQGAQFRSPSRGVMPPAGISGSHRPYHLLFHRCKNLTVRDIFLFQSAFHSVRIIQSSYVKLDGIHIYNRVNRNNDGFHFISSQYVHVSNCDVECQDDACALFGSCKFVTVANCSFSTRWSASPEQQQQPGIVRNISFNGIQATVAKPVQLPDVPFVSGYNPGEIFSCIVLNGMDEAFLENISFNDVHVTFPGGGTAEQAAVRDVPKVAGEYYEIGVPPAYALFARNVRGLTIYNVRFEVASDELRPAVVFDHVKDAAVNGLSVQGSEKAESLLRFIDTSDVLLSASRVLNPTPVFLQVEGARSDRITVDGGDLSRAAAPLAFKADAPQKSAKLRT